MEPGQLYDELNYVNHSRENRKKYAHLVISNPRLIPEVMKMAFDANDKKSPRAAWLLEFVARESLPSFYPYLDEFTKNMNLVHQDAAVRPMAKICEYLIEAYYQDKDMSIKPPLTQTHKQRITELCFDYLITDQKVAPKAYSLNVLYLLGTEFEWIHPELKTIIERDYHKATAGFKARSRHILKRLKNAG